MKPEDIHLNDLYRIIVGEMPAIFYVELVLRSLFIYIVLISSMRLMGKRMASQIGRTEMATVASLAAAVGIPLMNPDRGLLAGLVIAITIVTLQVWLARRSARSQKFEALSQDKIALLVSDGIMDLAEMKKNRITRQRVFAQLRTSKQLHLGNVKRLYLEANGLFSLLENKEPQPGLSIIPERDLEFVARHTSKTDLMACGLCGYVDSTKTFTPHDNCPLCTTTDWKPAVK